MTTTDGILNWRRWTQNITLSGQPTEDQLALLRAEGVTHIINLGPHTNKGALPNEPASVAALGMDYIYIPVDFDAPTDDDFTSFCEKLDALCGVSIHVHCIYNARVSAFMYRRAKDGLGGDVGAAFVLMDGIWRPGDDWATFIDSKDAVGKPNRYAGEDY